MRSQMEILSWFSGGTCAACQGARSRIWTRGTSAAAKRVIATFLCFFATLAPLRAADRAILNFNPDWKFTKSDPAGAQQAELNDRDWTTVSTPHTYNDVDTFSELSPGNMRGRNQSVVRPNLVSQNLHASRIHARQARLHRIPSRPASRRGLSQRQIAGNL